MYICFLTIHYSFTMYFNMWKGRLALTPSLCFYIAFFLTIPFFPGENLMPSHVFISLTTAKGISVILLLEWSGCFKALPRRVWGITLKTHNNKNIFCLFKQVKTILHKFSNDIKLIKVLVILKKINYNSI